MNNQSLIIYNYLIVFKILSELEDNLNFKIIKLNEDMLDQFDKKNYENNLFLTKRKILNIENQFVLEEFPIKISKLVEKINIEFLKLNFKGKSNYKIGNYIIDLNSKNILRDKKILKLTEKEISTILYLSKFKKPISVKELQLKVWDHKSVLETHTVETHIHRLRKKIKEKFDDGEFIVSHKAGYLIN